MLHFASEIALELWLSVVTHVDVLLTLGLVRGGASRPWTREVSQCCVFLLIGTYASMSLVCSRVLDSWIIDSLLALFLWLISSRTIWAWFISHWIVVLIWGLIGTGWLATCSSTLHFNSLINWSLVIHDLVERTLIILSWVSWLATLSICKLLLHLFVLLSHWSCIEISFILWWHLIWVHTWALTHTMLSTSMWWYTMKMMLLSLWRNWGSSII